MISETLAPDVAWEPSGHLSEVALSVLSDGEDALLDGAMLAHAGACDACAARLGEVALRSVEVSEALAGRPAIAPAGRPAIAPAGRPAVALAGVAKEAPVIPVAALAPASRPARRKVPVGAVAAAMAIAVIGAAPAMLMLPAEARQTASVLRKVLPSLVKMLAAALARLWSGSTAAGAALVWGLSLALVLTGLAIAKRASRKTVMDGGSR